jgi:hypothetical protein
VEAKIMKKVLLGSVIALGLPLVAQTQGQDGQTLPQRLGGNTPLTTNATQPVPRMSDGTVDLWGTWVGGGPVGNIEEQGGLPKGTLNSIMLPAAKARMAAQKETDDPHVYCLPMGVPRQAGGFPWRFVRYPTHGPATHMFVLFEGNARMYRQIFMDGRKHPVDPTPTWWGHSIGRWEGDTLVVDSVGFNDRFWFDRAGHPHTEQLHTIERWTRVDFATLANQVTIDDPGAYSRPFTVNFKASLSKPGDELMEYICLENNQFGLAGGHDNPYDGK